jgi:hypothetical protein
LIFILITVINIFFHTNVQYSLITLHRTNTPSVISGVACMIHKCPAIPQNSSHFRDLMTFLRTYEHTDIQIRKVPIRNSVPVSLFLVGQSEKKSSVLYIAQLNVLFCELLNSRIWLLSNRFSGNFE